MFIGVSGHRRFDAKLARDTVRCCLSMDMTSVSREADTSGLDGWLRPTNLLLHGHPRPYLADT